MAERAAKTTKAGTRGPARRKTATAPVKPRAREPRITQADFDELFARMDERLTRMEASAERVKRVLGV